MPIVEGKYGLEYMLPVDASGKPYFVPIVMSNKDRLIGFQEGASTIISDFAIDDSLYSPSIYMSSERFIDMTNKGVYLHQLSELELEDYLREQMDADMEKIEHPSGVSFDEYFLCVECSCGNFHGFESPADIPATNLICGICEKTMIEYIDKEDSELLYVGIDPARIEDITIKLQDELIDNDQEEL